MKSKTTVETIDGGILNLDFDESIEFLSNTIKDNIDEESDCLLKEIQKLTLKVKQQSEMIKERDIEIKRLKSTTISAFLLFLLLYWIFLLLGMPTDENARNYIAYVANRIKLSTNGFKYNGNLFVW